MVGRGADVQHAFAGSKGLGLTLDRDSTLLVVILLSQSTCETDILKSRPRGIAEAGGVLCAGSLGLVGSGNGLEDSSAFFAEGFGGVVKVG